MRFNKFLFKRFGSNVLKALQGSFWPNLRNLELCRYVDVNVELLDEDRDFRVLNEVADVDDDEDDDEAVNMDGCISGGDERYE